jgi:hypothetical protein
MTAMATQHIGLVRSAIEAQAISERIGVPIDEITPEIRWEWAMGSMDDDASDHWPRWPYRFPWPPAETEWPRDLPDLLTEGNDDDN